MGPPGANVADLTCFWHPSGLGGGTIDGTPYTGFSTTVSVPIGRYIAISAQTPVGADNFSAWGGGETDQLQLPASVNSNSVLIPSNGVDMIADY